MNVIEAERMLYERMRECAVAELGSSASEAEIKKPRRRASANRPRP